MCLNIVEKCSCVSGRFCDDGSDIFLIVARVDDIIGCSPTEDVSLNVNLYKSLIAHLAVLNVDEDHLLVLSFDSKQCMRYFPTLSMLGVEKSMLLLTHHCLYKCWCLVYDVFVLASLCFLLNSAISSRCRFLFLSIYTHTYHTQLMSVGIEYYYPHSPPRYVVNISLPLSM